MWKRDESDPPGPERASSPSRPSDHATSHAADRGVETSTPNIPNIGRSVVIKGELTGSEDLIIDGQVDGTINLLEHQLTIGPGGKIKAHVSAKSVVVVGRIDGNITATEKIQIREDGTVEGDVTAPRISIADGARFRGSVDMRASTGSHQSPAPSPHPEPQNDASSVKDPQSRGRRAPGGAARVAAPPTP